MSHVYLLHLDPPYQGKKHYIGHTYRSVTLRLAEHRKCKFPNAFTARAVRAGSKLSLVYQWTAGLKFESWLKEQYPAKEWCPVCGINSKRIPRPTDMPKKKFVAERVDDLSIDRAAARAFGYNFGDIS